MGEAIPGPGNVAPIPEGSIGFLRMNYKEEDHLGKEPFVPKAILH